MIKVSYTSGGLDYNLEESSNYIVVRTKKGKTFSDLKQDAGTSKALQGLKPKIEIEHARVMVMQIPGSAQDAKARRDELRKQLKSDTENIEFAGRVLKDPETGKPVIYTNNIFIKFGDKVPVEVQDQILADSKLKKKEPVIHFSSNAFFVEPIEDIGADVFSLCKKLFRLKEVTYCEPELIRQMGKKKSTIHDLQWHLKATKIGRQKINASASVDAAHSLSKGKGIIIAVIDDGVDMSHPEFKGKIVFPRDVSLNIPDANPKLREDNHGTPCAGVACAQGIHACGVAPDADLMPIRNVSELGSKDEAFAIVWAADHGADIISCSWGPEDGVWWSWRDKLHSKYHPISALTNDAIEYAATKGRNGKGCIILFAAGNGNEDCDPDKYISHEKVIAVAACNDRGKKSVYSDYGKSVWVCFPSNDFESVYPKNPAPVSNGIYTTDRTGFAGHKRKGNNGYCDNFGGTSSACPGVAGICALILEANPDLTFSEVKHILRVTADRIDEKNGKYDAKGHSIYYGYGRANAMKAVLMARSLVAPKESTIVVKRVSLGRKVR